MTTSTQSQIAYEKIRSDLVSCRILPGQRVRINETVARLNLNLSAVREALSRLAAEGLLIATEQRGFRAAPISADDLRDLTPVRIEIEISCLRRSLRNGDLSWESNLASAFHKLSKTPMFEEGPPLRSSDSFALAHDQFHHALISACDNRWLLRIRDILYSQWERYRRLAIQTSNSGRDLNQEHLNLYNAALERDADKIALLFHDHLSKMTNILLSERHFFDGPKTSLVTEVDLPDETVWRLG